MANFEASEMSLSNINNGVRYQNGDIPDAEAINAPIEASFYAQEFAKALAAAPDVSEAGNTGTPSVSLVDNGAYKKFKFANLKGEKGEQGDKGNDGNGIPIITATSYNGVDYTASFEGITSYEDGMPIIVVPQTTSASTLCTLNINSVGMVNLISEPYIGTGGFSTATNPVSMSNWLMSGAPFLAIYSSYHGVFLVKAKSYATPIEAGGTSAVSALGAMEKFGICDTEAKDFNSNNFDGWLGQVQNYVLQKVGRSSKIPFFFNCGWAGRGFGTAVAWSTAQMIFVMILQDQDSVGARVYSCNPEGVWKNIHFQNS